MIVIISLLLILALLALFIGLIKPKFIKFKSRKKVLVYGLPIILILFIAGVISAPELTPEQRLAIEQREAEKERVAAVKAEEKEREKEEKEKEKKEKEEQERKEQEEQESKENEKREKDKETTDDKQQENKEAQRSSTEVSNAQTENNNDEKNAKNDAKPDAQNKINLNNASDSNDIIRLLKDSYDRVGDVMLEKDIAIVVYSGDSFWSETSAFKDFAIDSTGIMRKLQGNKNLSGVGFVQMMTMIDQKGNESIERTFITYFDKENYDDINFTNFVNTIYARPSNFYEVSDGYWIHPGVFQNIKSDTLDGLPFTPNQTSDGFEVVSSTTN